MATPNLTPRRLAVLKAIPATERRTVGEVFAPTGEWEFVRWGTETVTGVVALFRQAGWVAMDRHLYPQGYPIALTDAGRTALEEARSGG